MPEGEVKLVEEGFAARLSRLSSEPLLECAGRSGKEEEEGEEEVVVVVVVDVRTDGERFWSAENGERTCDRANGFLGNVKVCGESRTWPR
jgi:hypothetical protein